MVVKTIEETSAKAVLGSQKMCAGFTAAGKQSAAGTAMMAKGSNQAMTAVTGLNWIVSDSPYFFQNMRMGIMAVSNNITPLVQNMAYAKKEAGSMKAVFGLMGKQLMGPMGVVFAITTVIAIIQALSFIMAKHKAKTEGSTEANKEFAKSLEQINKVVSIDALESQLETSNKLIIASEQDLKNKKEKMKMLSAELGLLEAQQNIGSQYSQALQTTNLQTSANQAKRLKDKKEEVDKLQSEIDNLSQINREEKQRIEKARARLALLNQIEFSSEKEMRYKEKVFEYETSKLPITEQIAAWEAEKAKITGNELEDKEKLLEIEKKLDALRENQKTSSKSDDSGLLSAQKAADASRASYEKMKNNYDLFLQGIDTSGDAYLQKQIARIEAEVQKTSEGTIERANLEKQLDDYNSQLIQNRMDRTEAMLEYEKSYQGELASVIADGSIESVYENMFSNIKQKVIQFWLDKLSITKAMMQMEEAITLLGEGKIQAFLDILFPKRIAQRKAEALAAGESAAIKSVDSASGIPFPGNIAAIGLVLASVFSSLRKAKVTGSQIVAAAEGAVINKPTLLLAGEALSRSGTEIVMPEKNFNRYMESQVIPGIMAKVNVNNSGLEKRMERVENAIYSIGRQIPNETGKAVTKAMRGKF